MDQRRLLPGALLPWSTPHTACWEDSRVPSATAQSHHCLWASQVLSTGQRPPPTPASPGPQMYHTAPRAGADWAPSHPGMPLAPNVPSSSLGGSRCPPVLPGPLASTPGSVPFRQGTAPVPPSGTPLHTCPVTDPGLSCKWGPWVIAAGHFSSTWRAQCRIPWSEPAALGDSGK